MAGEISKIKTSDGVEHALEVDLSNYYTKSEDDALLGAKADSSAVYTKSESDLLLANKADKTDIYTKAQLDLLFDSKANVNTVYTKGETDNLLSDKADVATTYTKSETDTLLLGKADANDVYPKSQTYNRTQTDDLLATKADNANVYSKSDVDTALGLKADASDVYTKTEADALLGAKADSADVYTITQTDALLDAKANLDDSSTTSTVATWSADKLHTEFQNCAKLDSINTFEVYQIINSSGIDTTDTPSVTTWGDGVSFGDKNNVRTGFIAPSQNTDGSVDICINTDNGNVLINNIPMTPTILHDGVGTATTLAQAIPIITSVLTNYQGILARIIIEINGCALKWQGGANWAMERLRPHALTEYEWLMIELTTPSIRQVYTQAGAIMGRDCASDALNSLKIYIG